MRPDPTPLDVIDQHVESLREIARRLLVQNEQLRKREIDLSARLADALERVAELDVKVREKDQLIEELQQLRAGRTR